MKGTREDIDEGYQAALNISETLIKSREVVAQSKNLLSKIKSFNDFQCKSIYEITSPDQSVLENTQRSHVLKENDIDTYNNKENTDLQDKLIQLQLEILFLNNQIKEKDLKIARYEEILFTNASKSNRLSIETNNDLSESTKTNKINLRSSFDEKIQPSEKEILEQRLQNINVEYNKQVSINNQLKIIINDSKNLKKKLYFPIKALKNYQRD